MEKVWVSKQGDNDDDGLKDSPVATITEAILRSQANGEVVVGDGQYDENLSLIWPGMKVRAQNAGKVIVKGHHRGEQRAVGAGLGPGLRLHGGPDVLNKGFGPLMYGDGVFIDACEVTNFNATIGVHVQNYYGVAPVGCRITRSRIHHCGEMPRTNYEHGIYLGVCKDVVVRGNWIHDNADRGVQCYSDADRVLVEFNTFVANNQNMHFGGSDTAASDNCVARRNVIAYGREWNLDSSFAPNRPGVGNIATENYLWMPDGSDGVKRPTTGFTEYGNTIWEPEFIDLDGRDLTIKGAEWQAYRLPKWLRELDAA